MPAVIFVVYLIYGFVRPALPKRLRNEIEDVADGAAATEEFGEEAAGLPSFGEK